MIKLVMCISRRKDMTREEFQEHWLNHHGPHFMEVAKSYRVKKYVQSHTLDTQLNALVRDIKGLLTAAILRRAKQQVAVHTFLTSRSRPQSIPLTIVLPRFASVNIREARPSPTPQEKQQEEEPCRQRQRRHHHRWRLRRDRKCTRPKSRHHVGSRMPASG